MGTSGLFISWISEAIASIIASLSNPKTWGVIFAVFILIILYSIVSSINRLSRRLTSASSELSAIRATLKKLEWSLGKFDAKRSPDDKEGKDLRDLLFRVDDDQRQ
jgi:predicted branched-subunit amino acid permease